jgi:CTP:molybdopterin cytidylyltransferase MocA
MEVVILCGGKGTRSYPFTEYFPKVMMPIGGTPVLVHLMRIYADQGFTNFILAAGHRKEILTDYFEGRFQDSSTPGMKRIRVSGCCDASHGFPSDSLPPMAMVWAMWTWPRCWTCMSPGGDSPRLRPFR